MLLYNVKSAKITMTIKRRLGYRNGGSEADLEVECAAKHKSVKRTLTIPLSFSLLKLNMP